FCHRILAEHPIEAGLPPRFEVLDEVRQDLAWRSEWAAMIDVLGGDTDDGALFEVALLLGLKTSRLQDLSRAMSSEWHRCAELPSGARDVVALVRGEVDRAASVVRAAFEAAASAGAACPDPTDRLALKCALAGRLAALLSSGSDWRDCLALLASGSSEIKAAKDGACPTWGPERFDIREDLKRAQAARSTMLAEVVDLCGKALARLFGTFAVRAARARCARGELLYHDLLVLARDLLSSMPEVRSGVQERCKLLLIDEFQDTDPLQLEIAELVASAGASSGRHLFRVGDPQQAIYSFRGADIEAYNEARRRFVASGATVTTLTSNFRSVPAVLDFVNECFGPLLPGHTALDAVRRAPAAAPAVHFAGGEQDPAGGAADRRHEEALDCAEIVRRAARDSWLVGAAAEDGPRPLRYGDIALLLPRRTGLDQIEAALAAAGIGYRVESTDLLLRTQDVRDMLALLRVIGSAGDHLATVAVLRSSLFGCADDELCDFRRAGGSWSLDDPLVVPEAEGEDPPRGAVRVARALAQLRSFRAVAYASGAVAAFEHALETRRAMQLAAAGPNPREAWRRIRFVKEAFRRFVSAAGGGAAEFADWVDAQLADNLRPAESIVPELDEDVVRIMTVHAAKGLEFPVAVLVGFGTTSASPVRPVLHRDEAGGCEVNFRAAMRTAGYDALDQVRREAEQADEMRLVYVAATRARDHLVVCAHRPCRPATATSQVTAFERFCEAAFAARSQVPDLFEVVELERGDEFGRADERGRAGTGGSRGPGEAAGTGEVAPGAVGAVLEEYEAFKGARRVLAEAAVAPWHLSATEVQRLASEGAGSPREGTERGAAVDGRGRVGEAQGADLPGDGAQDDKGEDLSGDDPAGGLAGHGPTTLRRGRAGTRLGRAVHASLHALPLSLARSIAQGGEHAGGRPGEVLASICATQTAAERIAERAGEVERLVRAALSSPAVSHGLVSGPVRRELYVSTTVSSVILDGYIDLCYRLDDGSYVIVDYKTDLLRDDAALDDLVVRYELQAAAYALALGDVTGAPVRRAVLVFLSPPDRPIERDVADLGSQMERVRHLVSSAAGPRDRLL
ncbi:MAG: UvrD-helicase domain-containing protein, partial [Acidimicrobiales bacterium]